MRIIFGSLMVKLVVFFLLVALVPIGIVGYLSFNNARQALQEEILGKLRIVRERGEEDVAAYLKQNLGEMKYLASNPGVQSAFRDLSAYLDYALYLDYAKANPNSPIDKMNEDYKRLQGDIDPIFTRFLENFSEERGYDDILLVVGDNQGFILYTAKKLNDLGTSLKTGPLKDSSLAKLWKRVVETKQPALVDLSMYEPSGTVSTFLGVPVFRDDKQMQGVLVLRFDSKHLNSILAEIIHHVGKGGDVVVVGSDYLLRSLSASNKSGILQVKEESEAVKKGLQGLNGVGELMGPGGSLALNAWSPVGIRDIKGLGADFDWAVVARLDSSEAFGPVRTLAVQIMLIAGVIGLIVAVFAFSLARTIVKPISRLSETATQISQGDLSTEIPQFNRRDEIAILASAFHSMAANLREQIKEVMTGVNVLSASASEISTTVSQVGVNASKVSSAITETTTTVEQVKQSAKLSSDKAKEVALSAQETVTTSEEGRKATEEAIVRIRLIQEQMESIGETVIKLSEHSMTIENIVSVVQDLADQSNLLAVNASIEAARAGERGKGFSVVAQEIKSLAEQSRGATDQIRSILADTRKWVSAVVMATEQGAKAVQAGVAQSKSAEQSIETLSATVIRASQAAAVIGASTEQQFVGVDQVSQAMTSVDQAMRQNVEGMTQLEQAATRLHDLGGQLQNVITRYKV